MSHLWSQEREDRLRLLHAEQLSFSAIAERMGVSKNMVVGKANRMGLPARKDPTAHAAEGKANGKKAHGRKFQFTLTRKRPNVPRVKEEVVAGSSAPSDAPPPLTHHVNISFLKNKGCMWPEDDLFCGRIKHPKSSYCIAHERASRAQ